MPITPVQPAGTDQRPTVTPRQHPEHGFSALLDRQGKISPTPTAGPKDLPDKQAVPAPTANSEADGLIRIGEINQATPSVSHLLLTHPSFRHECWEIIFAKINQGKPFTSIEPGMVVSLNPTTQELVWNAPPTQPTAAASDQEPPSTQSPPEEQISLGTIAADTPTVSHLLTSTPRYRDQAWEIIFSEANRHKPYGSLHPGTRVTINPQTLELSFKEENDAVDISPAPPIAQAGPNPVTPSVELGDEQKDFAKRLVASVKSYLGQPYHKIDCYDLVVRGLKGQGVQYSGQGGLLQHLEQQALRHGLPANTYQNGEGLIEAAGHKFYDESFVRIKSADRQAAEVLDQLQPLLQEGMLLSFSTPTRGHTGVIAQKDGRWTYVNSGMIDHQVNGGKISRRVGEETLADEIRNWFVLARKNGTSLKVSAGMFDTKKLQATGNLVARNPASDREVI